MIMNSTSESFSDNDNLAPIVRYFNQICLLNTIYRDTDNIIIIIMTDLTLEKVHTKMNVLLFIRFI